MVNGLCLVYSWYRIPGLHRTHITARSFFLFSMIALRCRGQKPLPPHAFETQALPYCCTTGLRWRLSRFKEAGRGEEGREWG